MLGCLELTWFDWVFGHLKDNVRTPTNCAHSDREHMY